MALRHVNVFITSELGHSGDIYVSNNILGIVEQLALKECDFIICAAQKEPNDLDQLKMYTDEIDLNFLVVKSY